MFLGMHPSHQRHNWGKMRRTFVVNEPRYCVGWDVPPTVITTAYLIFWGPLFAVTLINWDWDYEDAKESTAHEVLISPRSKPNPAQPIPKSQIQNDEYHPNDPSP